MIAKVEGNLTGFPSQVKAEIKKTFWELESWNVNSLWVISNTMEIYDFDDLEGLVNSDISIILVIFMTMMMRLLNC